MSSEPHIQDDLFQTETLFATVIIPLGFPKNYTYRIPSHLTHNVQVGCRVLVNFGKRKVYTAIVKSISAVPPKHYEAKYILHLLDDVPLVNADVLQFWEWMAAYYMCAEGDVMIAALPNYMRLESHTVIQWNDDADEREFILSNEETEILNLVHQERKLPIDRFETNYSPEVLWKLIRGLYDKGLLLLSEEVEEKYKAKKVHRLLLNEEYKNNEELVKTFFDKTEKRAPKQHHALLVFFGAQLDHEEVYEEDLVQKFPELKAAFKQLIVKGIINSIEEDELPLRIKRSGSGRFIETEKEEISKQISEALTHEKPVFFRSGNYTSRRNILAALVAEYSQKGGQVLYLLPESAVSPHLVHAIKQFVPHEVWMYTGKFSERERFECWKAVSSGDAKIVVGSRTSLLLPFKDLSLIILDEEHDSFYKQRDPAPRFHARDSALMLGSLRKVPVLLSSSAPSMETEFLVRNGKFTEIKDNHIPAPNRHIEIAKIIHGKESNMVGAFTKTLLSQIATTLDSGRQVILFQNLKGYVPVISCRNCGWIARCTNCDVTLTFYKSQHTLRCNYCNHQNSPINQCLACGSHNLEQTGYGTERIEEELETLLPLNIRIGRFDLESTRSKKNLYKLLQDFEDGTIHVLIGTQMFTRLIDYSNVGLIAVLNADMLINYPDFRAQEKAFQLLSQLYERNAAPGFERKLLIQARNVEHPLFKMLDAGNKEVFYAQEMAVRREFIYPPFARLIQLRVRHKEQTVAEAAALLLGQHLRAIYGEWIVGPQKPTVSKVRNLYIQHLLVKIPRGSNQLNSVKEKIKHAISELYLHKNFKTVKVVTDVDCD